MLTAKPGSQLRLQGASRPSAAVAAARTAALRGRTRLAALPAPELTPQQVTNAVYTVLGLSGLSFVATFGLAPRFKGAFKEGVDWRDIYAALTAAGGVRQVEPEEAFAKASSKGAVLVDVRLGSKYEASHAAGSRSVPLYLPIQGWSPADNIRRAGFAFFGIYGTELNTQFAQQLAAAVPRNKPVLLLCENGGSLKNKSGTKFGFQSRSLKAAYYLQQAGVKNVAVVRGGVAAWARAKLPLAAGPQEEEEPAGLDDDNDQGPGSRSGSLKLLLPQLASVFSR